jgi:thioredoxin reductase (NADPH)
MKLHTDLAIIGAGLAGVSAAVYAKRAGLDFFLFEPRLVGGQLAFIERIDNYVGLGVGSKGRDFKALLEKTLKDLEIDIIPEEIKKIEIEKNQIRLISESSNYIAHGTIVASGASFKKLGLKDEDDFTGKGISYCAICDGLFFKNKDVAVVGGGNTAVEEALYLSDICRKVYLIHRREQLRAIDYLQKELSKKNNVETIFNSEVRKLNGKECLESIAIENSQNNKTTALNISGLFIAIGVKPQTEIFKGMLTMDEAGFILTNEEMRTSCDFIWAAGDCRKRPLRQLITAASEGAIAAIAAYKYLKGGYISA